MPSGNHILLFARYPVPGETKTRLIPALGHVGAARLHRRMAEGAVTAARTARSSRPDAGITVQFTGAPAKTFRAWLGQDLQYSAQSSGDLGERMGKAFQSVLEPGPAAAVCIGSDVPAITPAILQQAFESLGDHDVVLGPANDGGYYLIGMKRFYPELFSGIEWGTGQVWKQTWAAAARMGLRVAQLPTLPDVDRPEDLEPLRRDPRFADCFTGKASLSLIIPTLNEAGGLGRVLDRVRGQAGVEIIVADGGSRDGTKEIAAQAGARVLEAPGGRAGQLNAGALAASGRLLLFLHADTLPPQNYADLIREALDDPSTVAGAFRFQTDGSGALMRLIEQSANLRSTFLHLPYGDQGLFMEKRVFGEMGGFAPIPVMEDYELVLRLRRRGTVRTLRESAVTSARRWQGIGIARTTLINMAMIAGFTLGLPPERLARFYRMRGASLKKDRCGDSGRKAS